MNKIESFQQFLATQSIQVELVGFIVNLLLSAALAATLSWLYVRYGESLSNRGQFAGNFVLLAMTTMVIITIVKSSLALSLGLVGALSIVRFRAAIKEPQELSYLFLCIAIGLGLGANQRAITVVAFVIIASVIIFKRSLKSREKNQNLHLTVGAPDSNSVSLEQIVSTLKEHCSVVNLRRFDDTGKELEASFLIEFDGFDQLTKSREALRKLDSSLRITFLDNKGVL